MQVDLTGRTALITGASMGIGRAMAARFSASGANVVMLARGEAVLREAAEGIRGAARGEVLPLFCDITSATRRDEAVAQAKAAFGTIDILVNNAGSSRRGPVEEQTRDGIVEDLDLKVLAPLALVQSVLPEMKAQRWGRILNIAAIVGKHPAAGSLPTSLSRSAGISMTKTLSKELAPYNILVNALCVGKIKSGQWERRYEASGKTDSYDAFLEPTARTIPLGRMGEPEEFAQLACFLASDLGSYITGTAINVDGGLSSAT